MFLIALTGGIASGKTTVCDLIKKLGIPVIDADEIARKVVEPGSGVFNAIRNHFGSDILDTNGDLDRKKLADIVFNNEVKRKTLNRITHPAITRQILLKCLIYFLKGEAYVILDLPLFFESAKMKSFISKVIVVYCEPDQQLERLMRRNDFTMEEAKSRIESQMPLCKKREMADYVIHNDSESKNLTNQVTKVINELNSSKFHWKLRFLGFLIVSSIVLVIWQIFILL